jgi:hypothetical protein
MGRNNVTLSVRDPWRSSSPDQTQITVVDTQPPTIKVTLTPTVISPSKNRLVRIHAVVRSGDVCGEVSPEVVLTSITSNQPNDDRDDIQGADFGTFDRDFLLRAESKEKGKRIYTVTYRATDARGNQTVASATVQVSP